LEKFQKPDSKIKHLVRDGDLLRYNKQIFVGGNQLMHQKTLQALHSGTIGGHAGVQATLQRVRQLFACPDATDSQTICGSLCNVQASKGTKAAHVKYPGLLKPLKAPDEAW
jgi:hypothetical protein